MADVISTSQEITDRQKSIISIPENYTALVVGLGGIGSWVAVDLALLGVKTIIMCDPDRIEYTNLNRTLFKLEHAGRLKVDAIKELIAERREDVVVISHDERFEDRHLTKYRNVDVIFDCTDNLRTKELIAAMSDEIKINRYAKLGYDGFEATISLNDFKSGGWGEESGYTVIPSFFGSPQIISAVAIVEVLLGGNTNSETVGFDVRNILSAFRIDRKKQAEEMAVLVKEQQNNGNSNASVLDGVPTLSEHEAINEETNVA